MAEGLRYWLARPDGKPGDWPAFVDGCHSSPEGVAQAAKLYKRIFNDDGPWVMVTAGPVPELDPPINEDAARTCSYLVAEFGPSASREEQR